MRFGAALHREQEGGVPVAAVHTRHTHNLCDPEQPRRAMTVDFDAFVDGLVSMGEPGQQRLEDLMAGVDLIRAMDAEADDFGEEAPGVDARANFAERLAALTDEALEAAGALLEEAGRDDAGDLPAPGGV
ncbi:MAG: hypothetical protein ACRDSJ_13980, partial [Rubrobacteraceae bacterium]